MGVFTQTDFYIGREFLTGLIYAMIIDHHIAGHNMSPCFARIFGKAFLHQEMIQPYFQKLRHIHLPMQNSEKIRSSTSSEMVVPKRRSKARPAALSSAQTTSSAIASERAIRATCKDSRATINSSH